MQNKTSVTRLAARRRLGSISARTSRLEIDLWFERRAAQRAEQIALTCAARQKITFKNGQYGPVSSWAAASTRPQSVDWNSRQCSGSTHFKFISFSSCNWDLYSLRPAEGGATVRCDTINCLLLRWGKTSPLLCVSRLFCQRVFVVVMNFSVLSGQFIFSFFFILLMKIVWCKTIIDVFLFLWLYLNKITKCLTSVAYK